MINISKHDRYALARNKLCDRQKTKYNNPIKSYSKNLTVHDVIVLLYLPSHRSFAYIVSHPNSTDSESTGEKTTAW